ncbi:hypothetical protein [Eubacterium callanderi]|uniref:hypothetical protein n=1 Tax=Eubacterium callanderi TaxID=53442 RepID=UPI0029FF0D89|nr:hypothetical protein [Eubacterium callanderi]
MKQFEIKHMERKAANAFVAEYHRHHGPVTGHRFSLECIRRAGPLATVPPVDRGAAPGGRERYRRMKGQRKCMVPI